MLRDEAVALIAFRLGDRADLDEVIIRELNFQQRELENKPSLPWFLLSETSVASTVPGEERLPLPLDFLREPDEEAALWHYVEGSDAPWREISKQAYDRSRVKYIGQGIPQVYSIIAGYFRLSPAPDDVYQIKTMYYRRALPLSTNIENEWLKEAAGVLIGLTGSVLASSIGNQIATAGFTEQFKLANHSLSVQNTARQEANRSRHMGERP